MRHSPSLAPDFTQVFGAAVGSVELTPVVPLGAAAGRKPVAGPIDKEIRRIHSAHQPEVREVASDNEIGRDIVDEDARRLAEQQRAARKSKRKSRQTGP